MLESGRPVSIVQGIVSVEQQLAGIRRCTSDPTHRIRECCSDMIAVTVKVCSWFLLTHCIVPFKWGQLGLLKKPTCQMSCIREQEGCWERVEVLI